MNEHARSDRRGDEDDGEGSCFEDEDNDDGDGDDAEDDVDISDGMHLSQYASPTAV